MTIAILPARLANQIAAGEVVERPASVIKELIENSLDAGATAIHIEIEKGGIKKIRISDNGHGISKDELTLALSRHATSKIKDLSDLEAIDSLGFRGEALASISSVSRLTLTSKPEAQENAWQASAQGRDMEVTLKPAAHPNGTSIEVLDLFFNTPARRKFLRTEKTEFHHIDEVIRRIALARFDVGFTLTHNGKLIRQYRLANNKAQYAKRVAMVCGKKFIDNAIEIECQHDNMTLSGWLAKPSFSRNQNDLCYSYVNSRMMRDKLINHAIRQAYDNLLPHDSYPAFVLFLTLDHAEVDVNVHPAKHEVRFHQSRYVHDFIYSVCHKALQSEVSLPFHDENNVSIADDEQSTLHNDVGTPIQQHNDASVSHQTAGYIAPISSSEGSINTIQATYHKAKGTLGSSQAASNNYQQLMTPLTKETEIVIEENRTTNGDTDTQLGVSTIGRLFLVMASSSYAIYKTESEQSLRVLSLVKLAQSVQQQTVLNRWQQEEQGLVSQPLLLPVVLTISKQQSEFVQHQQTWLEQAGIVVQLKDRSNRIQIRQFPALLREKDVGTSFILIIDKLMSGQCYLDTQEISATEVCNAIAHALVVEEYCQSEAENLVVLTKKVFNEQFNATLHLNSVELDLTSHFMQLQ